MRRLFLIPMLAAAALGRAAAAQTEVLPPPPSFYRKVIPVDTGRNGYEEFTLAADLISRHPAKDRIYGRDQTLTEAREIVSMPESVQLVSLVRRALTKPVFSPRPNSHLRTAFEEFAGFRHLPRLLSMRLWVQLADGDSRGAAESAELAFGLSEVGHDGGVLGFSMSRAMTRVVLVTLAANLDRCSAVDSERFFDLCVSTAARRPSAEAIINTETRFLREATLNLLTAAAARGSEAAVAQLGLHASPEALRALDAAARPRMREAVMRQVDLDLRLQAEMQIQHAARPAWQRKPLAALPTLHPMSDATLGLFTTLWPKLLDQQVEDDAGWRLLTLHFLIRRFWWENGRYPFSLQELKRPELIIDPFTGEELLYEWSGETYRLRSAGPEIPDALPDGEGIENGRRPIDLVL